MKKYLPIINIVFIITILVFLVSCSKDTTSISTTKIDQYTIELDANGGSLDENIIYVNKGDNVELPTPTKIGRKFIGWFKELNKDAQMVNNETTIDGDYKLYAMWDKHIVTFLDGDNKEYYKVVVPNGIRVINPPKFPVEYTINNETLYFDGWDFDFSTPIYKDYVINSKWNNDKLTSIKVDIGSIFIEGKEMVDIPYRDSFFLKPNTVFNKELCLYALGSSITNRNKSTIGVFNTKSGFDNPYYSDTYDTDKIEEVAYCFSHRTIDDFEMINISINGFHYGMEFIDNFNIGNEPYHKAFNDRSIEVIDSLKNYIDAYYKDKKVKVLVTGYSRAGAVANIVGKMLISEYDFIDKDNIYVYTFEAPRGSVIDDNAYPYIFNMVNNADIVTQILPESYGNERAGIDCSIYDSNVDYYIKMFNSNLSIPEFDVYSSNYTNEIERTEYIISTLTKKAESSYKTLSTKEEFYENYQTSSMYFIELFFSLKDETIVSIMNTFQKEVNSLSKFFNLKGEGKIYNMVKPIIELDGFKYDDEKLRSTCDDLSQLIFGPANGLVSTVLVRYFSTKNLDSISRLGFHHDSLCSYILVSNYIMAD